MSEEYSDVHRAFVQACMNHGVMSMMQALNVLKPIIRKNSKNFFEPNPSEQDLREIVNQINNRLQEVEQKLVFVTMDLDLPHKDFLCFTQTTQSAVLKLPSVYAENECNYFRVIMEHIVVVNSFSIPVMLALNLCNDLSISTSSSKKITKQRAQDLIEEWIIAGYFIETDGAYYFGPRTIAEFGDTLRIRYAEHVRSCFLCRQTCFYGTHCPNEGCDIILHTRCAQRYGAEKSKCPSCQNHWKF